MLDNNANIMKIIFKHKLFPHFGVASYPTFKLKII